MNGFAEATPRSSRRCATTFCYVDAESLLPRLLREHRPTMNDVFKQNLLREWMQREGVIQLKQTVKFHRTQMKAKNWWLTEWDSKGPADQAIEELRTKLDTYAQGFQDMSQLLPGMQRLGFQTLAFKILNAYAKVDPAPIAQGNKDDMSEDLLLHTCRFAARLRQMLLTNSVHASVLERVANSEIRMSQILTNTLGKHKNLRFFRDITDRQTEEDQGLVADYIQALTNNADNGWEFEKLMKMMQGHATVHKWKGLRPSAITQILEQLDRYSPLRGCLEGLALMI